MVGRLNCLIFLLFLLPLIEYHFTWYHYYGVLFIFLRSETCIETIVKRDNRYFSIWFFQAQRNDYRKMEIILKLAESSRVERKRTERAFSWLNLCKRFDNKNNIFSRRRHARPTQYFTGIFFFFVSIAF